jgi:uncharacterized protein YjaG (DUF416 family)
MMTRRTWNLGPRTKRQRRLFDPADKVTFFCSLCRKVFPDFEGLIQHAKDCPTIDGPLR